MLCFKKVTMNDRENKKGYHSVILQLYISVQHTVFCVVLLFSYSQKNTKTTYLSIFPDFPNLCAVV